jgi:hypothetical protein
LAFCPKQANYSKKVILKLFQKHTEETFLSQRKFSVSVEDECLRHGKCKQACLKVLSPTLFNMYINDVPQTHGVHLTPFADDTCLYETDRKEGLVLQNSSAVSAQWRPGVKAGI